MSITKFSITIVLSALLLVGCSTATTAPTPLPETPVPTNSPATVTISPTLAPASAVPATPVPAAVPTEPVQTPPEPVTSIESPTASNIERSWKWTRLDTSNAPPARYDHALALDTENKKLVLFGGRAEGQVFGDTWLYDLETNEWREIESPGPSARFGFASVYDPVTRAVYLFGGQQQEFFNDTWKFDTLTEKWSEVQTSGDKPDIRYGHGVTMDTQNHRLIISHGFARNGRHDDTWALDLETLGWTELTPAGDKPLKRCLHDIAYSPGSNTVYLYGGCSSGFGPCPQGDLWELDLDTNQWTLATPAGEMPSARENPSIVTDPSTGNLVLFGGKSDASVNDLWMFKAATKTWHQIALAGPSARKSHDAVFDPLSGLMYLFGGNTSEGAANDLWTLEEN